MRRQSASGKSYQMSLKIMSQVWEHQNLQTTTEKLVLLCLADFASDEGTCWPKMATVAAKCNLTERGARSVIEKLEMRGFLTREIRPGKSRSNVFLLHVEQGEKAPKPEPHSRNTIPVMESKTGTQLLKPEPHSRLPGSYSYKGEPSVSINEPSEGTAHAARTPPPTAENSPAGNPPSPPPQAAAESKKKPAPKTKSAAYVAGALIAFDDPLHVAVRRALHITEASTDDAKAAAEETGAALAAAGRDAESVHRFIANWWKLSFWGRQHKRKPRPAEMRNDFDEVLALSEGKNVRNTSAREQSRADTDAELDRFIADKLAESGFRPDGSVMGGDSAPTSQIVPAVQIRRNE